MAAAQAKADSVDPADVLISPTSLTSLGTLLPQFQTEVMERGLALSAQAAATAAVRDAAATLRMTASHFFQLMNLAIERGVLAAGDRAAFLLDVSQTNLPTMTADADLQMWAGRIVDGEGARATAGGTPVVFPAAAEVQAALTAYQTVKADQSNKQDAHDSAQEDVEGLRDEVDALILDMRDEIEFALRREEPASLRRDARQWGVVYVNRPGESDDDGGNGGLPAPTGLTLTIETDLSVTADWDDVTGAESYIISVQDVTGGDDFIEEPTGFPESQANLGPYLPDQTIAVKVAAVIARQRGPDSAAVEVTLPPAPPPNP